MGQAWHRNRVCVSVKQEARIVFGDIATGTCFRYLEPFDPDNVYMKIDIGCAPRAVHLNSGMVYEVKHDKAVAPLKEDMTVTLSSKV